MGALVKELVKIVSSDVRIDVITTQPNRYHSFKQTTAECEISQNVTVYRVPLPTHKSGMLDQSKAFITYYRQAFKIIKNNRYDLVFATSSRLMTAFLGVRLAKLVGAPVYLDIRDIFVDTIKDVFSEKPVFFLTPVLSLVERYTFRSANRINLVSKGFLPYFESLYPRLQYDCFTNGIDEEFIGNFPEKNDERVTNCRVKVLYAGNVGEGQGLHHIIPDLAALTAEKFEFVIVGDGGRYSQLAERVSSLGLQNVTLLPPVDRNKLINMYQEADVLFLHLNDYDAFKKVLPSKVFEYAATGKPILAGVAGYSRQFIESEIENAAVFEPCSAPDGVSALNRLKLKYTPRVSFIKNYRRTTIMSNMARVLMSEASGQMGRS